MRCLAREILELFIGYLEDQEIGQLLNIVAVAYSITPQDITEIPKLLHQRGSIIGHSNTLGGLEFDT